MYRVPDLPSDVENTYCVIMAIRVVEFLRGYKIRKVFAKESTYPKENIEF